MVYFKKFVRDRHRLWGMKLDRHNRLDNGEYRESGVEKKLQMEQSMFSASEKKQSTTRSKALKTANPICEVCQLSEQLCGKGCIENMMVEFRVSKYYFTVSMYHQGDLMKKTQRFITDQSYWEPVIM